jgi:hypothetical protein
MPWNLRVLALNAGSAIGNHSLKAFDSGHQGVVFSTEGGEVVGHGLHGFVVQYSARASHPPPSSYAAPPRCALNPCDGLLGSARERLYDYRPEPDLRATAIE